MNSSENRVAIGRRIKELRQEAGMTQQRMAAMVGMSRGSYSDIERGTRGYSIDSLNKVIVALGLTYTEFFQGIDGAEALLKSSRNQAR